MQIRAQAVGVQRMNFEQVICLLGQQGELHHVVVVAASESLRDDAEVDAAPGARPSPGIRAEENDLRHA